MYEEETLREGNEMFPRKIKQRCSSLQVFEHFNNQKSMRAHIPPFFAENGCYSSCKNYPHIIMAISR